jgi:hypothetical protein
MRQTTPTQQQNLPQRMDDDDDESNDADDGDIDYTYPPPAIVAPPAVLPTKKPSFHYNSINSDSCYAAVARFSRQPLSKSAAHVTLDMVDDEWAADTLSDDEVETARPEAVVAPLLEEGELDQDAIVVSPTGNSALAANNGEYTMSGVFWRYYFVVFSRRDETHSNLLNTFRSG